MKQENRGGKRSPSPGKTIGRPKKEPTATISFRVPAQRKSELFLLVSELLSNILNQ